MVVFNTWITILCSHDCLKSGSHGHHQMLCFLLERLCLAFTADTYGCWLFVGLFVSIWSLRNVSFICIEKHLGCFCTLLWVLMIYTVKHCSVSFAACGWIWADSVALHTSQFILPLLSVVTLSVITCLHWLIILSRNIVSTIIIVW